MGLGDHTIGGGWGGLSTRRHGTIYTRSVPMKPLQATSASPRAHRACHFGELQPRGLSAPDTRCLPQTIISIENRSPKHLVVGYWGPLGLAATTTELHREPPRIFEKKGLVNMAGQATVVWTVLGGECPVARRVRSCPLPLMLNTPNPQ